jgi:hypothetical protein
MEKEYSDQDLEVQIREKVNALKELLNRLEILLFRIKNVWQGSTHATPVPEFEEHLKSYNQLQAEVAGVCS